MLTHIAICIPPVQMTLANFQIRQCDSK